MVHRCRILCVGSALLALVLVVSACGSDNGGAGVPAASTSATTSGSDATDGRLTGDAAEAALLEYAACMRDNGVPDYPDPVGGRLVITPDMQLDQQAFGRADRVCGKYRKNAMPPPLSQQDKTALADAAVKFTKCMRENGIPLEDPNVTNGVAIPLGEPGSATHPDSREYKDANAECEHLLRDADKAFGAGS